jgi:replicative DNA helicase
MGIFDVTYDLDDQREIILPVLNIKQDIKTLLIFLYLHVKEIQESEEILEAIINIDLKYIPDKFLKDFIIKIIEYKRDGKRLRDIFMIEKFRKEEEKLDEILEEDADFYVISFSALKVRAIEKKLKSFYFFSRGLNLFDTRKDDGKNKLLEFEEEILELANEIKQTVNINESSIMLEKTPEMVFNTNKKPKRIITNTALDEVLELVKKDVHIFAAETGLGKTAFLIDMALNLEKMGYRGVFFSCEMGIEQLSERIVANLTKIPLKILKDDDLMKEVLANEEYKKKIEDIEKKKSKLRLIDGTFSISKIEDYVKREILVEKELDYIVIDYLQLLKDETLKNGTISYERVTSISKQLKEIAKENNIAILCIAQLSRAFSDRKKSLKEGEQLIMLPSDLKDSSQIEQDAGSITGLIVTNTELDELNCQKKLINLQILKQRSGNIRNDLEIEFITANQTIKFNRMETKLGYKPKEIIEDEQEQQSKEEEKIFAEQQEFPF